MPTCRKIIERAYRKLRELGAGQNVSDHDATLGLEALQTLFDGWAASGMFGPLADVYKVSEYTARAGERVRTTAAVILPAYTEVTPEGSSYDYGFDGAPNQPKDRSLIVVVNPTTGVRQTNIWDGWMGKWVRIEALTLTAECPLSAVGADDLACCLAKVIADEIGATLGAQSERRATLFTQRLAQGRDADRDSYWVAF